MEQKREIASYLTTTQVVGNRAGLIFLRKANFQDGPDLADMISMHTNSDINDARQFVNDLITGHLEGFIVTAIIANQIIGYEVVTYREAPDFYPGTMIRIHVDKRYQHEGIEAALAIKGHEIEIALLNK